MNESIQRGLAIANKFGNQNISAHLTELPSSIGIKLLKLAKGVTLPSSNDKLDTLL